MSPLHPCFYHPQTKRSMISRNVSGLMLRWSDISDLTEPCFVMASPSYPKQFASPPSLPPAAQFVWQPSPLTLLTYFLIGVVTEAAPLRGSSLHPQRNSRKSLCFFFIKRFTLSIVYYYPVFIEWPFRTNFIPSHFTLKPLFTFQVFFS